MGRTIMTMDPGIYEHVLEAEYRDWPALNKSSLDILHERSPLHYRYERDHPQAETEALTIGHAFHTLALEGEAAYSAGVVIGGPINTRTGRPYGRDTEAFRNWLSQFPPGRVVLTADDDSKIREMVKAIKEDETAGQFLDDDNGRNELSLLWKDDVTGLMCKGRLDMERVRNWGAIGDLKTTEDASPDGFSHSIDAWGYHRQAAWYLWGCRELGIAARLFAFLCVEKKPPYAVATYQLGASDIDLGEAQNRRLIDTIAECNKANSWPAYQTNFQTIGMPDWAFRKASKQ